MSESTFSYSDEISVVLAGAAGQGVQTVENILVGLLKRSNYHVYATKEYMSRVRGGVNSVEIRISSKPVTAFVNKIDIFVPLSKEAMKRKFLKQRLGPKSIVIGEAEILGDSVEGFPFFDAPFTKIAKDIGKTIYSNVVAAGVLTGIFGIKTIYAEDYIKAYFKDKDDTIIQNNIKAVQKGSGVADEILSTKKFNIHLTPDPEVKDRIIINGTESIGLGAIAGGCNFIGAYPMSPATGVLIFLSQKSKDFGIVVDQAEDEIAAINLTIGAWYAGARGIVTTSGGGFALMTEGVSLSGITETPFVLHLAQRVGPGTGLPTRTEQGDLNLVRYAGHGDFPRFIFAPGTLEEGFELTQQAFNLADKYQVPVFVLTDQYFVDSYYDIPAFDIDKYKIEKHVVETKPEYARYKFTDNGISPRGIPGYGKGFVAIDSDEHDESGHITEDHDIRNQMVEKRYFKKSKAMEADFVEPKFEGEEDYETLIICWGSTYHVVREALKLLRDDDIALLHYTQVYPIHPKTEGYLAQAKKIIFVEQNVTGQFATLIKTEMSYSADSRILKYSGLPFAVEEIVSRIREVMSK